MSDTTAPEARRTFAVIDGNSLMHRAFHAVPPTMNAPDGRPTNAVFGFLNMFLKMVDAFHPDGVAVAFDKGRPRVRMEMLPQYKAQRPPMDPDLRQQFPMVKDLLAGLKVPILEAEGWEGDDILGTLARQGEAAGCDMYLITGDRDMYQLSTEHVKIVGTKKGLSDVQIMTPETVEDLYHGITPALVPDFYGLKGDTSDNIPGVPGIGPKKASALIAQYGSLDEVIAHADEVKGKMGENLRAHIDDALLSRKVATIQTNAPVELDFSGTAFPAYTADDVTATLGALGIMAMQNRFLALLGGEGAAAAGPSELALPEVLRADIADKAAFERALAELDRAIAAGEWVGVALDDEAHRRDVRLMKDFGCNFIRIAHYPQDDAILEMCDRLGLLAWEEIPIINYVPDTPGFGDNCERNLREMIRQHYNHPSVILWGYMNEMRPRPGPTAGTSGARGRPHTPQRDGPGRQQCLQYHGTERNTPRGGLEPLPGMVWRRRDGLRQIRGLPARALPHASHHNQRIRCRVRQAPAHPAAPPVRL